MPARVMLLLVAMVEHVRVWDQVLNGVRAEGRLNPDCLREMIMFL